MRLWVSWTHVRLVGQNRSHHKVYTEWLSWSLHRIFLNRCLQSCHGKINVQFCTSISVRCPFAFKTTWMRRFCQMLLSKFKQLIYVLLFVCRPTVQPYRNLGFVYLQENESLDVAMSRFTFQGDTIWRWTQHYSLVPDYKFAITVPCFKHLGDYVFQGNELMCHLWL